MDFLFQLQVLARRHVISGFSTQLYITEPNAVHFGNETLTESWSDYWLVVCAGGEQVKLVRRKALQYRHEASYIRFKNVHSD